jgi:predicted PurR-regulated permease PerM
MSDLLNVKTENGPRNWANWVVILLGGSAILYLGRSLFIPLSFSILISFVLYPICRWLEKKMIGKIWAIVISLLLVTILLALVIALLVNQFIAFGQEWPKLQEKLLLSYDELSVFIEKNGELAVKPGKNGLPILSMIPHRQG